MEDSGFELVIVATINNQTVRLHLDTCKEKSISSRARIATQPIQDGTTMADHMWREPDEFSVSGTFGTFGMYENDDTYSTIDGIGTSGDRLTDIQNVFEYIKDNGILCDLTTIQGGEDGITRYKIRKNMALESMRWDEGQVSVKYSFTFKEIRVVNAQIFNPKVDDEHPNIYLPEARSLGQVMLEEKAGETSPYVTTILEALFAGGYLRQEDLELLKSWSANGNTLDKDNLSATEAKVSAFAKHIYTEQEVTNKAIGLFIIGLFVPGMNIASAINLFTLNKQWKEARAANAFKLFTGIEKYVDSNGTLNAQGALNDSAVNIDKEQLKKLNDFILKVKNSILKIETDCIIYQLSDGLDDNDDREVVLNIGSTPYYLSFSKSNTSNCWQIGIKTLGASGETSLNGTNGYVQNEFKACTSIAEMYDDVNALMVDATLNYTVFLYCPEFDANMSGDIWPRIYLANYSLFVVRGSLKDSIDKINDAINNELLNGGYV